MGTGLTPLPTSRHATNGHQHTGEHPVSRGGTGRELTPALQAGQGMFSWELHKEPQPVTSGFFDFIHCLFSQRWKPTSNSDDVCWISCTKSTLMDEALIWSQHILEVIS